MPSFHIYLISSLPMLHFGAKPPFSFEKFLELCAGLIPDEEAEILKSLTKATAAGFAYEGAQPTIKNWYAFETTLRNELVKIRAAHKKIDPSQYLRRESYADPSITHLGLAAYRNPSLLEGEKMLDEERWRVLDELTVGHYFDIDFLIVYAQKLLILERWEIIRRKDTHNLWQQKEKVA